MTEPRNIHDIVTRLRQRADWFKLVEGAGGRIERDLSDAADEIERLRAAGKPHGCICPGTLAAGCHAPLCPRRPSAFAPGQRPQAGGWNE